MGDPNEPVQKDQPQSLYFRRRRWRKFLRGIILLLAFAIILVAVSPYLVSTGPGRALVVSTVNSRIQGKLEISDLSLRWFGPTRLEGLSVTDPQGREVMYVDVARWSGGVFKAIFSAMDFENLTLDSPKVVLLPAGETCSVVEAFEPRQPKQPGEPTKLPSPNGVITINNGNIRIVNSAGREIEAKDFNGKFDLASLNEIKAEFSFALQGGQVQGDCEIRNYFQGNLLDVSQADGRLSITTSPEIDLSPLAEFVGEQVSGRANLNLTAELNSGKVVGDLVVTLKEIQSAKIGESVKPVDLTLVSHVESSATATTMTVNLSGKIANLNAALTYSPLGEPIKLRWRDLLSAMLTGQAVTTPEIHLAIKSGTVDLPALSQAVPGLLRLRDGVEIIGGQTRLSNIDIRGGETISAKGQVSLHGLEARVKGQAISYEPIILDFDTSLETGTGLKIESLTLLSDFAKVNITGTAGDLQGDFYTDLSLLGERLGELVEVGEFELSGDARGNLRLTRVDDNRVNFDGNIQTQSLGYIAGGKSLNLGRVQLSQAGFITLKDGSLQRVIVDRSTVKLEDKILLSSSHWYDLVSQGFDVDIQLQHGDLSYLAGVAGDMGYKGLERFDGAITMAAKASRENKDADITSSGEVIVGKLTADGRQLSDSDVKLRWAKLDLAADRKSIVLKTFKLDSDIATMNATDIRASTGPQVNIDLQYSVQADLSRAMAVAAIMGKYENSSQISGTLEVSGRSNATNASVRASGKGKIKNLIINDQPMGDGDFVLQNLQLLRDGKKISIEQADLKSGFANLQARDVHATLAEQFAMAGKFDVTADLAETFAIINALQGKEAKKLGGQLSWSGTAGTANEVVSLKGSGQIENFRAGVGKKAFVDKLVKFAHKIDVDQPNQTLKIIQASVKSTPLTVSAGGTIKQYTTARLADISGNYEASWEQLTKLLHELAPGIAEEISFQGKTASAFKLTGSLSGQPGQPVLRAASGDVNITWASGDLAGIKLGQAKFSPTMTDGVVNLPITVIDANGGKINLGAVVDMRKTPPVLTIARNEKFLEKIQINKVMGQQLLSRINPIFSQLASMEGQVSMQIYELSVPLSEEGKHSAHGRGRIVFSSFKAQPGGLLTELLKLGSIAVGQSQLFNISGLDFTLRDGRIYYKNFTMSFGPVYDLRFHGSVGIFDDTVDLVVSLPITPALLEQFGVVGPIGDYARLLSGVRIEIPLKGTRENPKLDMAGVDIGPLIEKAAELILLEQGVKILEDILSPRGR